MPEGGSAPEVWLLGSGGNSAKFAAQIGCAFSFANFISGADGSGVVRAYRKYFQPSPCLVQPQASAAFFVICAETEEESRRLASSSELWRLRIESGRDAPFPSVEEAQSYAYSEAERVRLEHARARSIVGDPAQVKRRLLEMAEGYDVDELLLVTITHDFAPRLRSYELIAQEFGLPAGASDSQPST
jgi:luciferase family oxidoreductase group 1